MRLVSGYSEKQYTGDKDVWDISCMGNRAGLDSLRRTIKKGQSPEGNKTKKTLAVAKTIINECLAMLKRIGKNEKYE